jgi:hypothetical protein
MFGPPAQQRRFLSDRVLRHMTSTPPMRSLPDPGAPVAVVELLEMLLDAGTDDTGLIVAARLMPNFHGSDEELVVASLPFRPTKSSIRGPEPADSSPSRSKCRRPFWLATGHLLDHGRGRLD